MQEFSNQKFRQEPYRTLLIETCDVFIQKGNYWGDTFGGVDLNTKTADNRLGEMIMEIRKQLPGNEP